MSTNNQLFFGDRSDVPDLLKSLADYSFSFPAFDDTGKNIFNVIYFKQKNTVALVKALYLLSYTVNCSSRVMY